MGGISSACQGRKRETRVMPAKSHVTHMDMLRTGFRLAGCILLLAGAVCAQDKSPSPLAAGKAVHTMRAPAPSKTQPTCSTTFQPFATCQIFASIEDGQVAVFNPDGTCVQLLTIPGTTSGFGLTAGSTFDANGNLYVTLFFDQNLPNGGIYVFDNNGDNNQNGTPFGCSPVLSCYNAAPESVGQAINGNFIVGQAFGTTQILEFDSKGNLLMTFSARDENKGTDWSDLQADQKTVYYTSEGISVLSFDISTNTQNPDFATNLPGSNAYAHRTLPNGNVLVADTDRVVQLDTSGNVVQTYMSALNPPPSVLFALNLDPDGKDFWTADLFSGQVYELNIATGVQVTTFNANNINGLGVAGLSI